MFAKQSSVPCHPWLYPDAVVWCLSIGYTCHAPTMASKTIHIAIRHLSCPTFPTMVSKALHVATRHLSYPHFPHYDVKGSTHGYQTSVMPPLWCQRLYTWLPDTCHAPTFHRMSKALHMATRHLSCPHFPHYGVKGSTHGYQTPVTPHFPHYGVNGSTHGYQTPVMPQFPRYGVKGSTHGYQTSVMPPLSPLWCHRLHTWLPDTCHAPTFPTMESRGLHMATRLLPCPHFPTMESWGLHTATRRTDIIIFMFVLYLIKVSTKPSCCIMYIYICVFTLYDHSFFMFFICQIE